MLFHRSMGGYRSRALGWAGIGLARMLMPSRIRRRLGFGGARGTAMLGLAAFDLLRARRRSRRI